MPLKHWITTLLLLPLWLFAQPAQPYFQSYTTEEGLGGEVINDILVDRYGYVWTAAFSGLHQFDGYDFKAYPADMLDSCSLSNRIALCLLEDQHGYLWVGTRAGLNRLDRTTGCFRRYFHEPERKNSLPDNEIVDLELDVDGSVLVQTPSGTARFQPELDGFERLSGPEQPWSRLMLHHGETIGAGPAGLGRLASNQPFARFTMPAPGGVHCLYSHGDSLLIGTSAGLYLWDGKDTLIRSLYPEDHRLTHTPILDIVPTNMHGTRGYWLASRGEGMGFLYLEEGWGGFYQTGTPRAFGLLDNHVRALTNDKSGNLWIGTYVGMNRLNLAGAEPGYYRNTVNDGLGEQVLELHADPHGGIFFYERWRGLFYSEQLGLAPDSLPFPRNDFLREHDLNNIYTDRSGLTWILRGREAIHRFDAKEQRFLPPIINTELESARLNSIQQDAEQDSVYWLGTSKGLARLKLPEQTFEWWAPSAFAPQLSGDVIATILTTKDGKIWLSAGNYYNDHLGYFDPQTLRFRFLDYQVGDPTKIGGGRIKQIVEDPNGRIWAAATQGLLKVDPVSFEPELITRVDNNSIGAVEAILVAPGGGIWFSTGDQIGFYQPDNRSLLRITCSAIRQFGNSVATNLPDGRLLFGGAGGMVAIDPEKWKLAEKDFPLLVLRQLRVNGAPFTTDRPIEEVEHLALGPNQRNFSLTFSGLYFTRTRKVNYGYRLNGTEWQNLGQERSLSFADLAPGTYLLELRASDGQGNWNPEARKLSIVVAPFWYETTIARLLLFLLVLGLLSLIAQVLLQRRLEHQKLLQLQELDAFKSRFFTNLTHEFRTPLTLILGPAKRLREQEDATIQREARRIDRQGRKLLELINQLLDLRKLQEGELPLLHEPLALDQLLEDLTASFSESARAKGIDISFSGGVAGAVEVDKSKVESIVTNLLANSLKFTPPNGAVNVALEHQGEELIITVADSGPGVPIKDRDRIFERFTRGGGSTAPGSGIGLALARELARLLEGDLRVTTSPLGGAAFALTLPYYPAKTNTPTIVPLNRPGSDDEMPLSSTQEVPGAALPRVLIVEDDPEVRAFLVESLSGHYGVVTANDGQSGLDRALAEIPDLVVSDVMMPGLNGLQLCTRLKTDRRTSHLPVLLLTARTAREHRMAGLEHGADAYLSKPFAERELHLRLRNLLSLRNETARRQREQLMAGKLDDQQPATAPESAFLTDLRQLIVHRLSDPDFGVGDLEKGLGLSRSQLHRKLTASLGLSANRLINQLRMEAAAVRLTNGTDSISVIAYDCGFRDVSYFGKRFREHYGLSPRQWRKTGEG